MCGRWGREGPKAALNRSHVPKNSRSRPWFSSAWPVTELAFRRDRWSRRGLTCPSNPCGFAGYTLQPRSPGAGTADIARHIRRLQNVKSLKTKSLLAQQDGFDPPFPAVQGLAPFYGSEKLSRPPGLKCQVFSQAWGMKIMSDRRGRALPQARRLARISVALTEESPQRNYFLHFCATNRRGG